MHPLLARYLNLDAAVDTLARDEAGQVLRSEERAFAEVARADEERRAAVLAARGKKQAPPEAQEALIFLAAHAAAQVVGEDAALSAPLAKAREALAKEGASESEIVHFIATLVLEEAFGYDDSADEFHADFFAETLDGVPALAALSKERVQQLYDAFVRTADAPWRPAHERVAAELIHIAWAEGPEPVNPEHIDGALDAAKEKLSPADAPRAGVAMKRLLAFLHKAQLLGEKRLERLSRHVDLCSENEGSGRVH